MMMQYAKAFVAIAGAAVTAALGIFPPNTQTWTLLTVLSAALTAAAVYLVPNQPPPAGK
jgi:predicted membrane channel-forming protein YqfA (hemolysin III family)